MEIQGNGFISKAPSFKELVNQQYISEVAFRLIAINHDNNVFASGTCFSISANLLLTAKHVIEDFIQKFNQGKQIPTEVDFNIWAIQIMAGNENPYIVWAISNVWLVPNSDIALLLMTPYCENAHKEATNRKVVKLNMYPPGIGSRIVGFGYHNSDVSNTNVINARFDGGMSGGPVFNDAGEVCGVICSTIPADESFSEHISYVTTLYPFILMKVEMTMDQGFPYNGVYPLIDLIRDGFIPAVNWEHFSTSK